MMIIDLPLVLSRVVGELRATVMTSARAARR
jgi:hypothetical protein